MAPESGGSGGCSEIPSSGGLVRAECPALRRRFPSGRPGRRLSLDAPPCLREPGFSKVGTSRPEPENSKAHARPNRQADPRESLRNERVLTNAGSTAPNACTRLEVKSFSHFGSRGFSASRAQRDAKASRTASRSGAPGESGALEPGRRGGGRGSTSDLRACGRPREIAGPATAQSLPGTTHQVPSMRSQTSSRSRTIVQ